MIEVEADYDGDIKKYVREVVLGLPDGSRSYRYYAAKYFIDKADIAVLDSNNFEDYQRYKPLFEKVIGVNLDQANESNKLSGLYVRAVAWGLDPKTKAYAHIAGLEYYLFNKHGEVYFGLPQYDIKDLTRACHRKPKSCGSYSIVGSQLKLTFDSKTRSVSLEKLGDKLKINGDIFYPVSDCHGVRFVGKWSASIVDQEVLSINFGANGKFTSNRLMHFSDDALTTPKLAISRYSGSGRYQIYNNELSLYYSDGEEEHFPFFIYPENEQECKPKNIVIGGIGYSLRN